MILGIDTDVLVHWLMAGAPYHRQTREFIKDQVETRGQRLGLTEQVVWECLHIITDSKRFPRPYTMNQAIAALRELWNVEEVVRIVAAEDVMERVLELLERYRLGRKRILDTALVATLERVGIKQLASFNGSDYAVFPFIELLSPC